MTADCNVLKQCPFCGSRAMFTGGGSSRNGKVPFRVECSSRLCFATVASATTREDAAAIWNLRSIETVGKTLVTKVEGV